MQKTWEVEQKYVVDEPSELLAALAGLQFELRDVETHRDVYLKHPSRNFRETDEALRIRGRGESACVTYKGPRLPGAVKTRPEIELEIATADVDSWLEMYRSLGFTPVPEVRKTRRHFHRSPTTAAPAPGDAPAILVCLDEVEQLGSFAEIELLVHDTEQLDAAHQQIGDLASQLGLSKVQPKSYLSQLLIKLGVE